MRERMVYMRDASLFRGDAVSKAALQIRHAIVTRLKSIVECTAKV